MAAPIPRRLNHHPGQGLSLGHSPKALLLNLLSPGPPSCAKGSPQSTYHSGRGPPCQLGCDRSSPRVQFLVLCKVKQRQTCQRLTGHHTRDRHRERDRRRRGFRWWCRFGSWGRRGRRRAGPGTQGPAGPWQPSSEEPRWLRGAPFQSRAQPGCEGAGVPGAAPGTPASAATSSECSFSCCLF